jgi:hypothetical protein
MPRSARWRSPRNACVPGLSRTRSSAARARRSRRPSRTDPRSPGRAAARSGGRARRPARRDGAASAANIRRDDRASEAVSRPRASRRCTSAPGEAASSSGCASIGVTRTPRSRSRCVCAGMRGGPTVSTSTSMPGRVRAAARRPAHRHPVGRRSREHGDRPGGRRARTCREEASHDLRAPHGPACSARASGPTRARRASARTARTSPDGRRVAATSCSRSGMRQWCSGPDPSREREGSGRVEPRALHPLRPERVRAAPARPARASSRRAARRTTSAVAPHSRSSSSRQAHAEPLDAADRCRGASGARHVNDVEVDVQHLGDLARLRHESDAGRPSGRRRGRPRTVTAGRRTSVRCRAPDARRIETDLLRRLAQCSTDRHPPPARCGLRGTTAARGASAGRDDVGSARAADRRQPSSSSTSTAPDACAGRWRALLVVTRASASRQACPERCAACRAALPGTRSGVPASPGWPCRRDAEHAPTHEQALRAHRASRPR